MTHDPDRLLKIEESMSSRFDEIAGEAEAMGYSAVDVADALLALACARVLALRANSDTEQAIKRAIRRIHGFYEDD